MSANAIDYSNTLSMNLQELHGTSTVEVISPNSTDEERWSGSPKDLLQKMASQRVESGNCEYIN